ncbi:MAG: hypothetical protein JWN70_786 [Planctomycetaceae bacterium]|nr:hypothetical protein [Planctomycetaceae bacterium]
MNEFVLCVSGVDLDVDACLSTCPFTPVHVWRKATAKSDDGSDHGLQTSGFKIELGNASAGFHDQQKTATEFVRHHRNILKAMAQFPGVETFGLVLVFQVTLTSGLCGFMISSSSELSWHALDVGLSINTVVWLEQEDIND